MLFEMLFKSFSTLFATIPFYNMAIFRINSKNVLININIKPRKVIKRVHIKRNVIFWSLNNDKHNGIGLVGKYNFLHINIADGAPVMEITAFRKNNLLKAILVRKIYCILVRGKRRDIFLKHGFIVYNNL